MFQSSEEFRKQWQISSLCTEFKATLQPCFEEGVSRHFVHQLANQVVLDDRGEIQPSIDRQFAVVMRLRRFSNLLPHMEDDLRRLHYRPAETLYLSLAAGDRHQAPEQVPPVGFRLDPGNGAGPSAEFAQTGDRPGPPADVHGHLWEQAFGRARRCAPHQAPHAHPRSDPHPSPLGAWGRGWGSRGWP